MNMRTVPTIQEKSYCIAKNDSKAKSQQVAQEGRGKMTPRPLALSFGGDKTKMPSPPNARGCASHIALGPAPDGRDQ
jgi:hypothetical protein